MKTLSTAALRAEHMRRNAEFFSRQASFARPEDVPVLIRAARKCAAGARDAEREAPAMPSGRRTMSPDAYPHTPGWRANSTGETARAAALAMAPKVKGIRAAVLADLIANGPSTPEEIAGRIRALLTTVRPRCSELTRLGLTHDSKVRRPGEGGRPAIVWAVNTAEERALHAARKAAEPRHG